MIFVDFLRKSAIFLKNSPPSPRCRAKANVSLRSGPPPRPSLRVFLLLAAAPPNIDDVGVCASALLDFCVWCSMLSFFGFRVGGLIATLLYESPGGNQVDGLPTVCNAVAL